MLGKILGLKYSVHSYIRSPVRGQVLLSLKEMTSSTRPREADISRYRHGCDPPEQKAKVASLSACKGRRALTRFRIQLIQLQCIFLPPVFRFQSKKRESENGEGAGLAFSSRLMSVGCPVRAVGRMLTFPPFEENP